MITSESTRDEIARELRRAIARWTENEISTFTLAGILDRISQALFLKGDSK